MTHPLAAPLRFVPVYHTLVWGGRAMAPFRAELPAGPIGESWDLADHPRGMSVVADGPLAGKTLSELTKTHGKALVGETYDGGEFPLLVKLIDANDRLSIQVHPDDDLAKSLGVGTRGKTECWFLLGDGGELYVGTAPGVTAASFEAARIAGNVAGSLVRHTTKDGDFFFIPARTVHALGKGCLLYEVQQTCDVTFRVDDWGRVGLDGKPRPLHVKESLATIDFAAPSQGAVVSSERPHPAGGSLRPLADCRYFTVEERRGEQLAGGGNGRCSIVICLGGHGTLSTAGGAVPLAPMTTTLVPADAGPWRAQAGGTHLVHAPLADQLGLRLLIAHP